MRTITIDLPETAFAALRKAPDEFARDMRIAAAVKWYELGELSQGKAAEIAGLSRAALLMPLSLQGFGFSIHSRRTGRGASW